MKLALAPISLAEANAFIARHHRHHGRVVGHKFSIGAMTTDTAAHIVGVCVVGRPVSRVRDDGLTLEVTRLCSDGTRNACSFLYGAAARAAFALGYKRIGTYILKSEDGASLRASGWRLIGETRGRSWSCPSRPRVDTAPLQDKLLFEATPFFEHEMSFSGPKSGSFAVSVTNPGTPSEHLSETRHEVGRRS